MRGLPSWKRLRRGAESASLQAWIKYSEAMMPFWRAKAVRKRHALVGTYVAVAGSSGKSTTTMLIGELLGRQGVAGVGLYANMERHALRNLRRLAEPVDYYVQEVSEFPQRGLAAIGTALAPDVVVVTSVGLDHLAAFRTREEVATELATLVATLPPTATLCVNADDGLALSLADEARARVILFGTARESDVRAENVETRLPGRLAFDLVAGNERFRVNSRFVGSLMLINLLGALAAVRALGLDLARAAADLSKIEPLFNRMGVTAFGRHTVVLDTEKAPMWTTRLLIDDLPNISDGRRIFVLGDMSDVGNMGGRMYRQVLRNATRNAALVIGLGASAAAAARLKAQEPALDVVAAGSIAELADTLDAQPPSIVVIKGNKLDVGPLFSARPPEVVAG